jgi:hypothetical protein
VIIAVLIIIAIVIIIMTFASKTKITTSTLPEIETSLVPTGIYCDKCGSKDFRFLWDKQIVADNKRLEVLPTGFTNKSNDYFGGSVGLTKNSGIYVHTGATKGRSESYKYKEISVKSFLISCRCMHCGFVWKEYVSEDDYPEIRKIPTMK